MPQHTMPDVPDMPMSTPAFWHNLFSPEGFMPRRYCGTWSPGLMRLHILSDFAIWGAYLAIPCVLIFFAWRKRRELPFQKLFVLFGVFILACGTTHLLEVVMFYDPIYRFAGLVKLVTACASWATVFALIPIVPRALAMRSPDELEREVQARTKELQNANVQLEEANRVKDEFLAVLSHELRTPLIPIIGYADLLQNDGVDADMVKESARVIERNARAQGALVEDLLDVSRIVAGKMALKVGTIDMPELVAETVESLHLKASERQIRVIQETRGDVPRISGDSTRLQQVASNLLNNALKFTPDGGQISMLIEPCDDFGGASSGVRLTISDSGQGIAPEFLPLIFDRFRQATHDHETRASGGLGLGLAIVRHIVELHGGHVEARSEGVDRGAQFIVTLPRSAVEATQESSHAVDVAAPEAGKNGAVSNGARSNKMAMDNDASKRELQSHAKI